MQHLKQLFTLQPLSHKLFDSVWAASNKRTNHNYDLRKNKEMYWGIKDNVITDDSHNDCSHSSQLNADRSTQQHMHFDTSTSPQLDVKETIKKQFLWTLLAHHLKANCFTYKSKAARLHLIHVLKMWKHELGGEECDHSSVLQEL